jgi:hypothetical protein
MTHLRCDFPFGFPVFPGDREMVGNPEAIASIEHTSIRSIDFPISRCFCMYKPPHKAKCS